MMSTNSFASIGFCHCREEMAKLYQMATVLYDVLKTVVPPGRIDEKVD